MSERRTLQFETLEEVMPEDDRLFKGGYRTIGRWSLGQICNHLTNAIRGSVEGGFPMAPWVIRVTIAKVIKRRLLSTGRMPDGIKTPKGFEPREQLDDRAEIEALRAAISLLGRHSGPMADHPFFGPTSLEEWRRFHAIHAAHHFEFAVPESSHRDNVDADSMISVEAGKRLVADPRCTARWGRSSWSF